MNVVDKVIAKALELRRKQDLELESIAQSACQWFDEFLAAAKESADSESGHHMPKTPSLKKRKLNPEPKESTPPLEEAKRPRKLKRNANESKRKKSISKKRSKSKTAAPPVRASTRTTRSSARKAEANTSQLQLDPKNQESILEEHEGLVDAQDSHGSNTTHSFIEHEADLEVQSFMAENHQKNSTLPSMVNINIDLTKLTVKHVEASKTAEDAQSGDANQKDKEKRSSDKANEIPAVVGSKSKEDVTKTVVPTKCRLSTGQNGLTAANMKDFNIEVVYLEPAVPETVRKIAKTPSLTSEKSQKSVPINKGSSKNSEPKPDSVEEVSQSPRAVMPQIARIKEQLFAKIKTPLNDKARQSEKLGNKGKVHSPVRPNTPETLSSPAFQRRVCQIDIEDSPDNVASNPVTEPPKGDTSKLTQNMQRTESPKTSNSMHQSPQKMHRKNNSSHQSSQEEDSAGIEDLDDQTVKRKGPKVLRANDALSGVHSIIKSANQPTEALKSLHCKSPQKKRHLEDTPSHQFNQEENSSGNRGSYEVDDHQPKRKGPTIFKPIIPNNVVSGVHSMVKPSNNHTEFVQGPIAKQSNLATGLFSFIKSNAPGKAETVEERKLRLEEDVKRKEESRKRKVEQAELRKQKEIDDRKRRRQEREQKVADAQAKKAQKEEERVRMALEKIESMKKNEERAKKQKEKEEETKKKVRERKMAEAEAKRQNEEQERLQKIADKEEEERQKQAFLQRKFEYEEQERKKKIEEQKRAEEERLENCARERQCQEERIRREIEERELQQKKRHEERLQKEKEERELHERRRMEKEKQEREVQERAKKERELHEKLIREKEQERRRKEEEVERKQKEARDLERKQREAREREALEKEKRLKEAKEKEIADKARRQRLAKEREMAEKERKLKEAKEREIAERERRQREAKERETQEKERKEKEAREAYYKKKLEQKQAAEPKRTFDKSDMVNKQAVPEVKSNKVMHPPNAPSKVQCMSYKTPTLSRVQPKTKKTKASIVTYDITELCEDDSTDDEEDPSQDIPSWARGLKFKVAITEQINSDIDPYEIFVDMLDPPKLEEMFPKLRARFFKRTSSAHWEQPPRPFKTML